MSQFLEIPQWPMAVPVKFFTQEGREIAIPHWHKEIEVIYMTKGSVNIGYNDEIVFLREGEIFVFSGGEPHYFLASPDSVRIVMQFNLSVFREQSTAKLGARSLETVFDNMENYSGNWSKSVTKQMSKIIVKANDEYEHPKIGYEYAIISYMNQFLINILRKIPQRLATQVNSKSVKAETINNKEKLDRLNDVYDYIENHYDDVITLEEASKIAGYSEYYFTRFFKSNTGVTFWHFLTDYRITRAKYILSNEDVPMMDVAERVGFNSVKTFHHVFKERVGMSPARYQKAISGNS